MDYFQPQQAPFLLLLFYDKVEMRSRKDGSMPEKIKIDLLAALSSTVL